VKVGASAPTFYKGFSMTLYHKHHIIPKHVGGTDDPSNLVRLTVSEHAEAHRVLFEEHGRWQDKLAWDGLAGSIGKEEIISRKLQTQLGKPHSEDRKKKISEAMKGIPRSGKHMLGNTNGKVLKGVPKSQSHKEKISKGLMGHISTQRKSIETPHGKFDSLTAASKALDLNYDQVKYRMSRNPDWRYA
jgi:hypothetical protein